MTQHIAKVTTTNGSRYLQQLCKHWSHKMPVEFDAQEGKITFPNGTIATLANAADTLDVTLDVPEGVDVVHMQKVVADHLDRFAYREAPLTFAWN